MISLLSSSGLIPRAIVHIFEGKDAEEDDDTMFDVRVSYIEIYNEEIRDLLGEDPTKKLEIKVREKGMREKICRDLDIE